MEEILRFAIVAVFIFTVLYLSFKVKNKKTNKKSC